MSYEYCEFQILENLSYERLLKFAQTNPDDSVRAARVFRRKFATSKFVLTNNSSVGLPGFVYKTLKPITGAIKHITDFSSQKEKNIITRNGNAKYLKIIEINNFDTILATLRHFGKYIESFQIIFANADSYEAKMISKFINDNCSESLVEIELDISKGNALKYMAQPFKRVQNVHFLNKLPKMAPSVVRMNETFPAMRVLSLSHLDTEIDYLNCFLPHLEHVEIVRGKVSGDHVIFNLFGINPHIKSISLFKYWPTFLNDFTAIAPQLEHITLCSCKSPIRHDKATKLTTTDNATSPNNVIMPKLQDLEMYFDSEFYDEWMDFLGTHQNIKRLVLQFKNLNDYQFQDLTEMLSNVEELLVVSTNRRLLRVETIVELLKKHEKLMRFNLNTIRKYDIEVFRKEFQNEWKIKQYDNDLCFERRILDLEPKQ